MGILPKKQMSEEDIKFEFITPILLNRGWKDKITMETKVKFTDGKINIVGNISHRNSPKRADYVLYINANNPIAIIEAKDNNHSVSFGLQQAKEYAKMLDIPFAYSSNGDAFQEFDFLTGIEREIPLDQFPTYDELVDRFKRESNNGEGLSNDELTVIDQPYYTSQTTNSPRYYQRIAVNRTVDLISKGQKRLLLVMATGTGKTFTAFQIIYRLLKAGVKRKILYLADRNILVDQSIAQDFSPLKKTIHKINFLKDNKTTITSFEVYFSLYQQLAGGEEEDNDEKGEDETISKLESLFKPDFFDFIVVDECHRGSAKKDSNWRKILEYFFSATQLGMTATPKETKYVSNIDYFGEPIYTYSLKNGIDDGFLAPFRVINITTNISEGWRPVKGQTDIYGNEIEDRIYDNKDYDKNIIIEDRINKVAQEITNYLKNNDRMAKTIVFCETEEHAELMRIALSNLNSDMVKKNSDYVVRITGSDVYGKSKLDYFISVSEKYPVIATTSKLLSTGVDCKMTKLIVLDQIIGSMTEFKQIVGRGTRLREKEGKTYFTIMDFRNVSRLFADPDWDGEPIIDPTFDPDGGKKDDKPNGEIVHDPAPPYENKKPFVDKNGCQVYIINKTISVYDTNNKLLKQENIIDYTKRNIIGDYSSLENFIKNWNTASKKQIIQNLLDDHGISLEELKKEENMLGVDDFDFICHIAFDKKPLTRKERAENVKKRDFLSKYSGVAREVLETLLEKYTDNSIYEIEDINVLKLDIFKHFGSPVKIASYFGGKGNYLKAVSELTNNIYGVA